LVAAETFAARPCVASLSADRVASPTACPSVPAINRPLLGSVCCLWPWRVISICRYRHAICQMRLARQPRRHQGLAGSAIAILFDLDPILQVLLKNSRAPDLYDCIVGGREFLKRGIYLLRCCGKLNVCLRRCVRL
jgi:hypothetical protein